jgi:hypothetical protein
VGGFILAWLVGEGIMVYRTYKKYHAPPGPGQLIWSSGLFVLLALVAESEKARPVATAAAWGFDIAAFLNLYPPVTGPVGSAQGAAQGGLAGPTNTGEKHATEKTVVPGPWPPAGKLPDNILLPGDTATATTAGAVQ